MPASLSVTRRCTALLFFLFLTAFVLPVNSIAAERSASFDLLLRSAAPGGIIPAVVFLGNRLTMDEVYPVARTLPMAARRRYVVDALRSRFHDMGAGLMVYLEARRKDGQVSLLRPLWVLNAIRVSATADVFDDIDKFFPEAVYIVGDPPHTNTLDLIGWGVRDIEAPRVWSTYDVTGQGVIVGHKDSGVDYNRSGFEGHIWLNAGEDLNGNGVVDASDRNNSDDDHNGYVDDFYGWNFDDDNANVADRDGHGTRTASVISSGFDTDCDTVCVAPGAKLMILSAYQSQGSVWESSQYAIEMGANVISASLSFKQSDCNDYQQFYDCPNYVGHRIVSEMELAAGLIHANSTGNAGLTNPVPLSVPAPANSPPPAMTAAHQQMGGVSSIVAVAAYNSAGGYYSGSGHGPSGWSRQDMCVHPRMAFCGPAGRGNQFPPEYEDYPYQHAAHRGLFKPDVAAPTDVLALASFADGGGCLFIGGTSGATPHVGGVCALLYSAFPGINPESAYRLLTAACSDSGPTGPDSLWGFGKIRPFPACSTGYATLGALSGVVSDQGGDPLAGVHVFTDSSNTVQTDALGIYAIYVPPGARPVHFEKYGYGDHVETVNFVAGQAAELNVTMAVAPMSSVSGVVTGGGQPVSNMFVSIPEIDLEASTDGSGHYTLNAYAGTYTIRSGGLPWEDFVQDIAIAEQPLTLDIGLVRSVRTLPTGPDLRGYIIYDDYDAPAAAYNWVEINPNAGGLPGTTIQISGDAAATVNLPFSFRFYGQDYTQITVSVNGFIVMGSVQTSEWVAYPIPSSSNPNGYLAVWFYDWEMQGTSRILYYNDTANHRFIVEWYNLPYGSGPGRTTFEAILYDPWTYVTPTGDGPIRYQYQMSSGRFEASAGLENQTGTDGLQYVYQLQYDPHAVPVDSGVALLITTDSTLGVPPPAPAAARLEFTLEQNYPNPFNPTTIFSWTVPRGMNVSLVLYDVLGRKAATIFEGFCAAGHHEQVFDGAALSAGIYFVRLETTAGPVAVRKVVLLK